MDWLIGKHSSETDGYTRLYLLSVFSLVCFSSPRQTQIRQISQDPRERRCLLLGGERQPVSQNSVGLLRDEKFCILFLSLSPLL